MIVGANVAVYHKRDVQSKNRKKASRCYTAQKVRPPDTVAEVTSRRFLDRWGSASLPERTGVGRGGVGRGGVGRYEAGWGGAEWGKEPRRRDWEGGSEAYCDAKT